MITSSATSQISANKTPPLNTLLKLVFSCLELARWLIMCGFQLKLEVDGGCVGQLELDLTSYSPLMLCCQQCRAQLQSLIWRMRSFLERQDRFIPPAGDICAIFFPSFWGVGVFWISRDFNGKWLHHVFLLLGNAQDCWMDDLHTQKNFVLLHLYYSYW